MTSRGATLAVTWSLTILLLGSIGGCAAPRQESSDRSDACPELRIGGVESDALRIATRPGCAAHPSPWAEAQHDTTRGFQDPLLDRFTGTWVLKGVMAGGDVVHDVTAEWVAGHQYLRFVELSREREDDGTRAYEAIVIIGWDAEHERYACLWLDSTGGSGLVNGIIGYAVRDADRLAFLFESPADDNRFHTTFAYDRERDAWEWRMDSERDGSYRAFARARMTRRD